MRSANTDEIAEGEHAAVDSVHDRREIRLAYERGLTTKKYTAAATIRAQLSCAATGP